MHVANLRKLMALLMCVVLIGTGAMAETNTASGADLSSFGDISEWTASASDTSQEPDEAGKGDPAPNGRIEIFIPMIESISKKAFETDIRYIAEANSLCMEFNAFSMTSESWDMMTDEEQSEALSTLSRMSDSFYSIIESALNGGTLLVVFRLSDQTTLAMYLNGIDVTWMLHDE